MGEKSGLNVPYLVKCMVNVTYIGNFLRLKSCILNTERILQFLESSGEGQGYFIRKLFYNFITFIL